MNNLSPRPLDTFWACARAISGRSTTKFTLERWLERHPEVEGREPDIRIVRGRWNLPEGIRTEVVTLSMIVAEDIAGDDPVHDRELDERHVAEAQDESHDRGDLEGRNLLMKPGRRDIRHKVLITGDELRELKRHASSIAEAFGLDRKIERYKGTRPITLFRWDLECLMDVIECELGAPRKYPDQTAPEYLALKKLGERLRTEYDRHYGDE